MHWGPVDPTPVNNHRRISIVHLPHFRSWKHDFCQRFIIYRLKKNKQDNQRDSYLLELTPVGRMKIERYKRSIDLCQVYPAYQLEVH